ncbi:hypothetical protein ACA910_001243 [Epithemia clementina (nom. ined.)]
MASQNFRKHPHVLYRGDNMDIDALEDTTRNATLADQVEGDLVILSEQPTQKAPILSRTGNSTVPEASRILFPQKPTLVEDDEDSDVVLDAIMEDKSMPQGIQNFSHEGSDCEFTRDAFDYASDDDVAEEAGGRCFDIARTFDMHLLRRSISEGLKVLEYVDGKEVVLIVGKTGTGKTTLVQALAGKMIYVAEHQSMSSSGELLQKTVFEAKDGLKGFKIGHGKVSETKHIHLHKETIAYSRNEGSKIKSKELVFLDSPGFQDTEGYEVDIATSVMLSQVAKRASRLRFVILINYVSLIEDRGGAVKGILKLVRTFVKDFEASKFAFMFLFTHTNENVRIAANYSLPDAREAVRKEILWTMKGTKDADLHQVLSHLQKTLKNKYPFVDVYHPTLSDIEALKSNIQRLQALPGDHLANHCGLTPTSKLKLIGALSKLCQDVRWILESDSPAIDRARDLLHTCGQLEAAIPVHEVRLRANEVRDICCGFIAYQRKLVQEQFDMGTSWDHEFGPANVATVRRSIQYLTELKNDFSREVDLEGINEQLVNGLETFCKKVKRESQKDLSNAHHHLNKMRAWSEGFPELKAYYTDSVQHISILVASAVACVEQFNQVSHLERASRERIESILVGLHFLRSGVAFADELQSHFDVSHAVGASDKAKANLEAAMDSCCHALSEETVKDAALQRREATCLVAQAKAIEVIDSFMERSAFFPDLKEKTQASKRQLLEAAAALINFACAEVEKNDVNNAAHAKDWLFYLQRMTKVFQEVGTQAWSDVLVPYRNIIEAHKHFLKSKSGELSTLARMTIDQGLQDGRRDGAALMFFTSYMFFDELLPEHDRFVANCFVAYVAHYKNRALTTMELVNDCIQNLHGRKGDSCEIFRTISSLLQEQAQMEHLGQVLQEQILINAKTESKSKLLEYVKDLAARTNAACAAWIVAIQNGDEDIAAHTKELCVSVREVEILGMLDLGCERALSLIQAEVNAATELFVQKVESTVSSNQAYEEKLKSLCSFAVIAEASQGTEFLSLDFEKLKEQARLGVRRHADEIQKSIVETTDLEAVKVELSNFERSKILDEYTSSEGTTRIQSLLILFEQQTTAVDSIVEEFIQTHNYKGLREFLSPSANSKDQIKKQKFGNCLARIATSLCMISDDIDRRLRFICPTDEHLRGVAKGINALQGAKTELGEYLLSVDRGFSLDDKLNYAKQNVNRRTMEFLAKMKRAVDANDFISLGTNQTYANLYERHLQDTFTSKTNGAFDESKLAFEKAVKTIESAVKEFAMTWFKSQTLLPLFRSLKVASEHRNPELPEIVVVYHDAKDHLARSLQEAMKMIKDHVSRKRCFDDAIRVLGELDKSLKKGLEIHIISTELLTDIQHHLKLWAEARAETDRNHFQHSINEQTIMSWKKELESLDPRTWGGTVRAFVSGDSLSFRDYRNKVAARVREKMSSGEVAIQNRDYSTLRETISLLEIMERHLSGYILAARDASKKLKDSAFKLFRELCAQAKEALLSESLRREFQVIYENYRQLVVAVPFVVLAADDGREFKFTNQLVYETLRKDVDQLDEWKGSFDFQLLKKRIERLRVLGGYIADYATLFHQEMRVSELGQDEWLLKTFQLCQQHFHSGRDFGRINFYALLGLPPSATKQEIDKAYRAKARDTHPDKQENDQGKDEGARFRQIAQARESLLAGAPEIKPHDRSFDDLLRGIHVEIRKSVTMLLREQRYGEVERVLFHLGELYLLDDLVSPPLRSAQTTTDIMEIVKGRVQQIKVEIESNWAERKYQSLNGNISDLKQMESKFKSYPQIFSSSWNCGIIKMIEQEIISLRQNAQAHLLNEATAKSSAHDFRRCFIEMGKVLVELAPFKQFTKGRMSEVLEECLSHDWGHSFLFEFGLGLQRYDGNSTDEENLVAQMILTEFSHFKEVLTMVWNEETSQKPVEGTVNDIRGFVWESGQEKQASIDSGRLLKSYREFESEYQSLLGDFLHPDADLAVLVNKIIGMADTLKPCSCNAHWGGKTKDKIPYILAGVFAAFTILKSGESYRRMESSAIGALSDKILMKPHNIQVLTLLCMFGCGSPMTDSLESQLMQIRTGEGKSIILGAAAVLLGLLGFRVRCVCYSEYLSNRDYNLFSEVFEAFQLTELVKYSKITTLAEDTTASKGSIRLLSEKLFRGSLEKKGTIYHSQSLSQKQLCSSASPCGFPATIASTDASFPGDTGQECTTNDLIQYETRALSESSALESGISCRQASVSGWRWPRWAGHDRSAGVVSKSQITDIDDFDTSLKEPPAQHTPMTKQYPSAGTQQNQVLVAEEILLVDEVDIFFGPEFYGQTYNQVVQIQEPAVETILRQIWEANKAGGSRLRLGDIQKTKAYQTLLQKLPGFDFLVDSEISAMLNEVDLVDEEPYYVDKEFGQIGYKVMDSVNFDATYGYRTVFAYLKEAENGRLSNKQVAKHMAMQVSCARFSYANISPSRVLGVSGTLDAMRDYEKDVLNKYGLRKFLFVPSVYGQSNFSFDKAGRGVRVEKDRSDYFQSITDQIQEERKKKRALIVFFANKEVMDEYTNSGFYRK